MPKHKPHSYRPVVQPDGTVEFQDPYLRTVVRYGSAEFPRHRAPLCPPMVQVLN